MKGVFSVERWVDTSPFWLKSLYVKVMRLVKKVAKFFGILDLLDAKSKQSQTCHYLRSLLAIHHLDDMIELDISWWTYDAMSFVERFISEREGKVRVFEYGSGASTLWLAKRCQSVISIEHDPVWYRQLTQYSHELANTDIRLKEPTLEESVDDRYLSVKVKNRSFADYVESIKSSDSAFDVIVIDGRCRNACFDAALPHLSAGGIVVFDNSNRKRYQSVLNDPSIRVTRFYGRVPGSPFKSETAIISHS